MKNYLFPFREEKFNVIMNTNFKLDRPLKVVTHKNAVISPKEFSFENNCQKNHFGGVITEENIYCKNSAFYRWKIPLEEDQFELTDTSIYKGAEFIDEVVVFGGFFYTHWGHFLMEMTSRLWYYINNNCTEKKIKLVIPTRKKERLTGNFKRFYEMLGIYNKDIIYIDDKPKRFKEVIVPEQSTVITKYYTDEFMVPFRKIYETVEPKSIKKVYFSRARLDKNGDTFGEQRIEKCMRKNKFEIFYPEKLELSKMIGILKGAEYVAGMTGTLSHNFIFTNKKTKIIMINREEYINPSQEMIRQEIGHDCSYIDAFYNFLPTHPGHGPYCVGVNDNFKKYLEDNKFIVHRYQRGIKDNQISKFMVSWNKKYCKSNDSFVIDRKLSDCLDLIYEQFK